MSGAPHPLVEFQKRFASEKDCAAYLFAARWPDGFQCPACGHAKAWPHRGSASFANAPVAAVRPR
jgi:Transposase zinc-ribbon domain